MKIALFSEVSAPKIDGITNRLRHTLAELRRGGHEVLVFGPENAAPEFEGFRVVRTPGLPFPPYPELRLCAPDPRLVWALHRFGAQVVHAVNPLCVGVWGSLAARALGLPLVASYHTDIERYLPGYGLGWAQPALWPLLRGVHGLAHQNLCPSTATRAELRDRGVAVHGLWRGGVDTARFHPDRASPAMRRRLSAGRPDAPLLVYVGRLAREKQLHTLRPVLECFPAARLALVGDGPARGELEAHFAGTATHFAGFLRGDALAEAYASADLFVMPSTTETLGFVVLEAMSSGTGVVAARAGGIPDLLDDSGGGALYDPDQPGALLEAVGAYLENPFQRVHAGEFGRKRALECAWEAETVRLLDRYRAAIAMARSTGLRRLVRLVTP